MPEQPKPIETKKRFPKLPKFIRTFLPHKMKRQVKELFVASIIVNFALAMVQIFEPIYLYQMGYSLTKIALFYLVVYALYFFLITVFHSFLMLSEEVLEMLWFCGLY